MNSEYIKHLKDDKFRIMEEKRAAIKNADAVSFCRVQNSTLSYATKDIAGGTSKLSYMDVELIINTTGLLDSHDDVHVEGLWDESLKNLGTVYLLQEHERHFDKVISDEVKASVEMRTWKELGAPYEGSTQALVFRARIYKERNPLMYDQYLNGYVRNHSVGMRYGELELCVNSDEKYYIEEKEAWDKYIDQVANREEAEERGYFWAVTRATMIEGSAVLIGSNWVTPTVDVNVKSKSIFSRMGKNFINQ